MNKKFQVFISSTFIDLEQERKIVTERVIEMGMIPSAMEMFPATSTNQLDYISKVIDDCDYYVLILGGRYGSTTADGISFTEAEYDYAVAQGKYVLAFVHADPGSFPLNKVDGSDLLRQKLAAFRDKVSTGRIVKMWRTVTELAAATTSSLHHAVTSSPGIGWVRGNEALDPAVKAALEEKLRSVWGLERRLETAEKQRDESMEAIRAAFFGSVKPATSAEIKLWTDQCTKEELDELESSWVLKRDVYYAPHDFVLPILHGAAAVTVIVAIGAKAYRVGRSGHSRLLFLDGHRQLDP